MIDIWNKPGLSYFYEFPNIEGSASPIDVVTNYKNLEYFCTTKLLTQRQACWSKYLLQFNLIIRFHPGKLRENPDALTRQWDIYLKEGGSNYRISPSHLTDVTHTPSKYHHGL